MVTDDPEDDDKPIPGCGKCGDRLNDVINVGMAHGQQAIPKLLDLCPVNGISLAFAAAVSYMCGVINAASGPDHWDENLEMLISDLREGVEAMKEDHGAATPDMKNMKPQGNA